MEKKIETVGNFKIDTIEDYFNYINSKPNYQKKEIKFRGITSLPKDYIHDEKTIKVKKVTKRYKERADSIESIFKYITYSPKYKESYRLYIRRRGITIFSKQFKLASDVIKLRDLLIQT